MKTKSGSVDVVDEGEERWSRLLGTRPSSLQIVLRSDQVTQSGAEPFHARDQWTMSACVALPGALGRPTHPNLTAQAARAHEKCIAL